MTERVLAIFCGTFGTKFLQYLLRLWNCKIETLQWTMEHAIRFLSIEGNGVQMLHMYDLPACELTSSYDHTLRSILDKHAPVQSGKALSVRPRIPWFDEELKELKIKRRKLERKMRKSKLDLDICAYRASCREYNSHLKDAKTKNYSHLIEDCTGDSRKLFQVV